ncbi:hypothetical protein HK405_000621, partial [Cladochytrium tenue]
LDLVLVHWPGAAGLPPSSERHAGLRRETWAALERLSREGRARAIGVSNYGESHLRELLEYAEIRPTVNQIEIHPLHHPRDGVIAFCRAHGIQVQAYSSFGEGALLSERAAAAPATQTAARAVCTIAERLRNRGSGSSQASATPAAVLLAWARQHGYALIPKASSRERLAENFWAASGGLELGDEDMALLDGLTAQDGVGLPTTKFCWDSSAVA